MRRRSGDLDITFRGGETTIAMDLVKEGVPYWSRPDLGIAAGDVRVAGRDISVTVHSLGAVAAPRSTVVVRTRDGRVVARTAVGALPPPVDLRPKTATVHCTVPAGVDVTAGTVSVELPQNREITLQNNQVTLPPSP